MEPLLLVLSKAGTSRVQRAKLYFSLASSAASLGSTISYGNRARPFIVAFDWKTSRTQPEARIFPFANGTILCRKSHTSSADTSKDRGYALLYLSE